MKTTSPSLTVAVFYMAFCFSNAFNIQAQVYEWPFDYPVNDSPQYCLVHDMNQDGAPDFIGFDPTQNKIAIWLNDGYGIFDKNTLTLSTDIEALNALRRPYAIGDFNNDGHPDLMIARIFGSQVIEPFIYQNDGEGNFSISDNQLPAELESFIYLHAADFTNDGFTDIMVASTGMFRLYTGSADGSFNLAQTISESTSYMRWTFGDINGDGLMDFVVSSLASIANVGMVPSLHTFINNGNTSFTKTSLNDEFANGAVFDGDLALADFNGDGFLDIVVSGLTTTELMQSQLNNGEGMFTNILLNDGDGSFTEHLGHGLPRMFRGYVACADVDDDGDIDVFITGRRNAPFGNGTVHGGLLAQSAKFFSGVMLNDGAGNFVQAVPSSGFQKFGYPEFAPPRGHAFFEDFTGNGKPDLLINSLTQPSAAIPWQWELKIYSNRLDCNALTPGVLSSNLVDNSFCPESLGGSVILNVSNNTGLGKFGIVRNSNGRIVRANDSGILNIDSLPPGNYTAAHLSYLLPGQVQDVQFVSELKGCRTFSNLIPFTIAPCESGIIHSQPNPTTGISTVSFTLPENSRATLEVYDMSGRLVSSLFNAIAEMGIDYRFDFDGSHLPNGVYLYRLSTTHDVMVEKFMIAR